MSTADARFKMRLDMNKILRAVERGNIHAFRAAGSEVRRMAKLSIRRAKGPSAPGKPPHTQTGALKKAILFSANEKSVVVGTEHGKIEWAGSPHEHGGTYRGRKYPARPFMVPALERVRLDIPKFWRNSIQV